MISELINHPASKIIIIFVLIIILIFVGINIYQFYNTTSENSEERPTSATIMMVINIFIMATIIFLILFLLYLLFTNFCENREIISPLASSVAPVIAATVMPVITSQKSNVIMSNSPGKSVNFLGFDTDRKLAADFNPSQDLTVTACKYSSSESSNAHSSKTSTSKGSGVISNSDSGPLFLTPVMIPSVNASFRSLLSDNGELSERSFKSCQTFD